MTPEEFNRRMDFIVESQSRLAAAQERDRQDGIEFQDWSKRLFARLAGMEERQVYLLDHQSQRMDRLDNVYERWLTQNEQMLDLRRQALHLLNLILDRLPPALGTGKQSQ